MEFRAAGADYDPSDDPTLDEQGGVCRSPAPRNDPAKPAEEPVSGTSPAVQKRVAEYTPSGPTNDNAERTSARELSGYAEIGVSSRRDTLYAGAALLKGRNSESGLEVEYLSGSAQIGGEHEVQAALARTGVSGKSGSAGFEVFTLRATGGAHTEDGSIGINARAQATVVGAEGTLLIGDGSATFGVSFGVGAAVSLGIKHADSRTTICRELSDHGHRGSAPSTRAPGQRIGSRAVVTVPLPQKSRRLGAEEHAP